MASIRCTFSDNSNDLSLYLCLNLESAALGSMTEIRANGVSDKGLSKEQKKNG